MVTMIVLLDYTEQGLHGLKDTVKRADEFAKSAAGAGVNAKAIYWTVGAHDGLLVLEGPDEETVLGTVVRLATLGNVRTKTLRAFDRAGIQGVLDKA